MFKKKNIQIEIVIIENIIFPKVMLNVCSIVISLLIKSPK